MYVYISRNYLVKSNKGSSESYHSDRVRVDTVACIDSAVASNSIVCRRLASMQGEVLRYTNKPGDNEPDHCSDDRNIRLNSNHICTCQDVPMMGLPCCISEKLKCSTWLISDNSKLSENTRYKGLTRIPQDLHY